MICPRCGKTYRGVHTLVPRGLPATTVQLLKTVKSIILMLIPFIQIFTTHHIVLGWNQLGRMRESQKMFPFFPSPPPPPTWKILIFLQPITVMVEFTGWAAFSRSPHLKIHPTSQSLTRSPKRRTPEVAFILTETPPPHPPSIGAQPACRAEWVIKLCSQASHPWPSRSQPMGCWTGRGLQGGEIGTRRDIGLPTHQSLRREIVLSLGMGLEQNWELEQCACVHCTCMCVYRLYPPLAWSYTWLACWSHQQSDSREADASSSVTHSGAAD